MRFKYLNLLKLTTEARRSHLLKLLQESYVVFIKNPDVVDAVLEYGDALNAQAKCEPGVFSRRVTTVFENFWMNHAAS